MSDGRGSPVLGCLILIAAGIGVVAQSEGSDKPFGESRDASEIDKEEQERRRARAARPARR